MSNLTPCARSVHSLLGHRIGSASSALRLPIFYCLVSYRGIWRHTSRHSVGKRLERRESHSYFTLSGNKTVKINAKANSGRDSFKSPIDNGNIGGCGAVCKAGEVVVIKGVVKIEFGPLPIDYEDAGNRVEKLVIQKASDIMRLVGIIEYPKEPKSLNFRKATYRSLTFTTHCWQESRKRRMCDSTLKRMHCARNENNCT